MGIGISREGGEPSHVSARRSRNFHRGGYPVALRRGGIRQVSVHETWTSRPRNASALDRDAVITVRQPDPIRLTPRSASRLTPRLPKVTCRTNPAPAASPI